MNNTAVHSTQICHTKNNRGFTFFEVILAISIISVSLVGLIQAFIMIDRARLHSTQYTQALYLQELKLYEILHNEGSFQTTAEGIFEPPYEQFQWSVRQGAKTQNSFRDVDLTISWKVRNQIKEISLSTYARNKNEQDAKK